VASPGALSPLNTKLMPPGKRAALIARHGLTERLERIREHRLLLELISKMWRRKLLNGDRFL
jgi:ATP/maltotriose-dependent transcriptional regulator MalT